MYTAMVCVDTTPVMVVPFHSSGPRFGLSPGGVPGQTFRVSVGLALKPEMRDAKGTTPTRGRRFVYSCQYLVWVEVIKTVLYQRLWLTPQLYYIPRRRRQHFPGSCSFLCFVV